MKTIKYTPEMEDMIRKDYTEATSDTERAEIVQEYVDLWGKTERMIIAKLSKMRIYKTVPKVSKVTGGPAMTKEQIVKRITRICKFEADDLLGMEKSPKLVLLKVFKKFDELID